MNAEYGVFYKPGMCAIIDVARRDGRTMCHGHTLEEIREEYPDAELMDFNKALDLLELAQIERYQVGHATEISKEDFWDALECLPPVRWVRRNLSESFEMSERTCGDFTSCYVRLQDHYFSLQARVGTSHEDLCEMARGAA